MSILIYEPTAVLTRGSDTEFSIQASKERRNDNAAKTWLFSVGLNSTPGLPPTSFNLATAYILSGFLYANQRGLPNIAMCSGFENSIIDLASSTCLLAGSRILDLSSTSSGSATNGEKTLNSLSGFFTSARRPEFTVL